MALRWKNCNICWCMVCAYKNTWKQLFLTLWKIIIYSNIIYIDLFSLVCQKQSHMFFIVLIKIWKKYEEWILLGVFQSAESMLIFFLYTRTGIWFLTTIHVILSFYKLSNFVHVLDVKTVQTGTLSIRK